MVRFCSKIQRPVSLNWESPPRDLQCESVRRYSVFHSVDNKERQRQDRQRETERRERLTERSS